MEKDIILIDKKKDILKILEYSFKITYLILAIGTFNSFTFGTPIMSILVMVTFGLGCILMLERLLHWKQYISMPYLVWLVLFCVSFVVSTIANAKYGFMENAKWLVWTSFQMLLLYVVRNDKTIEEQKKEHTVISKIIIGYSFGAALISILLLLVRYSHMWVMEANDQRIIQGVLWGRLWGVYTDPNYGAVIGVISILLSLYFLHGLLGRKRVFYKLNIILQFLYIVFSDSRTGMVALLVSVGFYIYTTLLKKNSEKINVKQRLKNIFITVCICLLMLTGLKLVKIVYNEMVSPVMTTLFFSDEEENEDEEEKEMEEKIGREEDIKADPSNRRFDIWGSGIEILNTTPVVGTGYTTFVSYTKDNVPDTYVLTNDHGVFGNMHNSFLNILVYQGVFGFVAFMIFVFSTIIKVFKNIWILDGEQYRYAITMLSCIAAVVCSMMFLLEGVYTNSIGSIVLWSFLGYIIQLIFTQKTE